MQPIKVFRSLNDEEFLFDKEPGKGGGGPCGPGDLPLHRKPGRNLHGAGEGRRGGDESGVGKGRDVGDRSGIGVGRDVGNKSGVRAGRDVGDESDIRNSPNVRSPLHLHPPPPFPVHRRPPRSPGYGVRHYPWRGRHHDPGGQRSGWAADSHGGRKPGQSGLPDPDRAAGGRGGASGRSP